jgi:rfaE bifunctional protein nucleotidyltransferase chain/domain
VAASEEQQLAAADARRREASQAAAPGPVPPVAPEASPTPPPAPPAPEGPPADMFRASEGRWGSREVEITEVQLLDAEGRPRQVYASGAPMTIRLRVRAPAPVHDFVFGIGLFNAEGVCCYGTNTAIEEWVPDWLEGDGEVAFHIERLDLVEGTYRLDVAVHRRDGRPYDYHRLLYSFRVKSRVKDVGIFRLRHRWSFSPAVRFTRSPAARPAAARVVSRDEAAALVGRARRDGRRVVFTNGVFDLLHPGHARYLRLARAQGDLLIVGVNSDRSARANKGPGRPITPAAERAEIVAALECVDAVVIFDEDTPAELIRALEPDVLVKGADWPEDRIVGRETVEARGGEVVRVPVEAGYSTRGLIDAIRRTER